MLLESDLCRPASAAGAQYANAWAVTFAPSVSGRSTETGEQDDTVVVGGKVRPWVAQMLQAWLRKVDACKRLFSQIDFANIRSRLGRRQQRSQPPVAWSDAPCPSPLRSVDPPFCKNEVGSRSEEKRSLAQRQKRRQVRKACKTSSTTPAYVTCSTTRRPPGLQPVAHYPLGCHPSSRRVNSKHTLW